MFVLVSDCFCLGLVVLSVGAMPLRDLTNMNAIRKIADRDPEKGAKLYDYVARPYNNRPWLLRKVLRIKMPKKLAPT